MTTTTCPYVEDWQSFLTSEDESEFEDLESHITECASCRSLLNEIVDDPEIRYLNEIYLRDRDMDLGEPSPWVYATPLRPGPIRRLLRWMGWSR